MLDKFNRRINYLRVSVTDRCNLRCVYCMPEHGIKLIDHSKILSFEEITNIVKIAVNLGIDKVRITGGEPLVRKGIVNLVYMIAKIKGINVFAMTSNGTFLDKFAQPLADAGLNRVNISLDTTDPKKYNEITRLGDITRAFKGIEAAKKAKLLPVKINCVVKKSHKEVDAQLVAKFCKENDLELRFIRQMNLETGEFWKVENGTGGDCKHCNRIRLTANGMIKPCLFNDIAFDVRKLGAEKAIKKAVMKKPEYGTISNKNTFYNIGG